MLKNGKILKKIDLSPARPRESKKKSRSGETNAIAKVVGVDPLGGHPQDWRTPPSPGHTQCVAQWERKN